MSRGNPVHPTVLRVVAGLFALVCVAPATAEPLTLEQAFRAAAAGDPAIARFGARADAALARADARGALPAPELTLGVENVPTGSFALDADDMTMVRVGVRQTLPAWGMRASEREAATRDAGAEAAAGAERAVALRRAVREDFTTALAAEALVAAVDAELPRARAALEAAQAGYAAGTVGQDAVVDARLWLAELLEARLEAGADREGARAALANRVGPALAATARSAPLASDGLDAVAAADAARAALPAHPALRMDAERAAAAEAEAAAARAARRPEWMVDLAYGMRSGTGMGGAPRDDMVSLMVGVSLPFGARPRGTERAAAAEARAARAEGDDRLRELSARLDAALARHAALLEIERLYAELTTPAAALGQASALREFGAGRGDYAGLARAQRMRLMAERRAIAVTAARRMAAAEIDYLAGAREGDAR